MVWLDLPKKKHSWFLVGDYYLDLREASNMQEDIKIPKKKTTTPKQTSN